MAIWESQLQTCREVLQKAGIQASQLTALGIANQRETTVVWERAGGKPVYNAIVWQDRRTEALCDQLRERGLAEPIRAKTGLVLDPYFSGTKLRWILDNVPGLRQRAAAGELAVAAGTRVAISLLAKNESAPRVTTNLSLSTLENAMKGAPPAFWHIRQWQMLPAAGGASRR